MSKIFLCISLFVILCCEGASASQPEKQNNIELTEAEMLEYVALKAAEITNAKAIQREERYWTVMTGVFGGLGLAIVAGLTWMGWRTRKDLRTAAIQELGEMLRDEEKIRSQIADVAKLSLEAVRKDMQVEIAVSRLVQLAFEIKAAEDSVDNTLIKAIMRNIKVLAESEEGFEDISARAPSLTHALDAIVEKFCRLDRMEEIQDILAVAPYLLNEAPNVIQVLAQIFGRRYVGILPSNKKEDENFDTIYQAAVSGRYSELVLPFRLARLIRDQASPAQIQSLIHDILALTDQEVAVVSRIIEDCSDANKMANRPKGMHFVTEKSFTEAGRIFSEVLEQEAAKATS